MYVWCITSSQPIYAICTSGRVFFFSKASYHISCFNLSYVIFCSKTFNQISYCQKFPLFQQHLSPNSSTTFIMCTNVPCCSHYSSCHKFSLIYVSFKLDPWPFFAYHSCIRINVFLWVWFCWWSSNLWYAISLHSSSLDKIQRPMGLLILAPSIKEFG